MCVQGGIVALIFIIAAANAENCTTPNDEPADCISLYSCPVLIAAIVTQRYSSIEFVRKSSCGGTPSDPLVCCGSSSTFHLREKEAPLLVDVDLYKKEGSLPDRSYCGYQRADDYEHVVNGTTIDEFPWLAALRYQSGEKIRTLCSGSLISHRYVITAAHCIQNRHNLIPIAVRLGEYHVENQTDCITVNGFSECSEPPKDFGIEEKILHPAYSMDSRNNSIGLLRLDKSAMYSDFVRPICLPIDTASFPETMEVLTTSGWGAKSNDRNKQTETKKKTLTRLISKEDCDGLETENLSQLVTENYFCTRDLSNNTEFSCRGDDGAPVMYSIKHQWHLEGILVVATGCDAAPNRHIKVSSYLDWIKENIRP